MLTQEQAQQVVREAIVGVNPDAFGPLGRVGNMGFRVNPRGNKFDIALANASRHLIPEFDEAIRGVLGSQFGTLRSL